MTRHLSPETLALHREGAVSASEAAHVRAHLAACPGCLAIDAQLADLPSLLSVTPWPPMPQAVQVRIQIAIAHESVARGAARRAPDAGVAAAATDDAGTRQADEFAPAQIPGRPDLPERRRRFLRLRTLDWSSPLILRGFAAAGAVVVLVGIGMLFANARSSTPSAGGTSAGAPVHSAASRPTAAGNQLAQRPLAESPVSVNYRLNGQMATTTALVSDANFDKHSLPGEVRRNVARFPGMPSGGTLRAGPEISGKAANLPAGFDVPQLESCLNTVASGRIVLVTEIARYLGTPAAIIVLRSAGADVFDVVVVGFACSSGNPAIITTLTVPRH